MNVTQMLCHLADSYEIALGHRTAAPFPIPAPRLIKRFALWTPMRWARGLQTVPEVDVTRAGAQIGSFAEEHARLLNMFEEFVSCRSLAGNPHPMFGPMREMDWHRWGYLHPDHHLRQFGA